MVDVPPHERAEDSPALEVGVLLDREPGVMAEWLADAAAFDAAGADALWVDAGPEPELDVLTLAAALAVVTFRARLVVAPASASLAAAGLARTLDTIGRLSHRRLALLADAGRCAELAAIAPGVGMFRRVPGEPGTFESAGAVESAGVVESVGAVESAARRWVSVPPPHGRQSWHAACAAAVKRGAQGVVVPADPRLLDILRNPDDPIGRHDLQLAQG